MVMYNARRFRTWMMTIRYTSTDYIGEEEIKERLFSLKDIRYFMFQLLKDVDGAYHQILCTFDNSKSFQMMEEKFP